MNIIRKIKLNKLGYYNFSEEELKIVELYEKYFTDLTKVKINNVTYYFKSKKFIMRYDVMNFYPDINNEISQYVMTNFINLEYFNKVDLISKIIGEILKVKITSWDNVDNYHYIERIEYLYAE